MKKNIVIVHYNTPHLTECLVRSINLFVKDAVIYIFDNSDKNPFVANFDNVKIIDNTKGQIINFNEWLKNYPGKDNSGGKRNHWGSAKHCYSVEKCMEILGESFVLMDSDILLKKDISEFFQEDCIYVGEKVLQPSSNIERLLPFICFINTKMCVENNINYFDDNYMHGLRKTAEGDRYDTGAIFVKNAETFKHVDLKISEYIVHFNNGSWMSTTNKRHSLTEEEWLNRYKNLWQGGRNKKVIYTCITGGYDELKEPNVISDEFDYICFTDSLFMRNGIWDIRPLPKETEGLSQVKKQRYVKINAHKVLPEYEVSIWVDGIVTIKGNLNELLENVLKDDTSIYVPTHPVRNCIYKEANTVVKMKKDTKEVVVPQIDRYKKEGYPEENGLLQSNILIRRHNEEDCIRLMEAWYDELKDNSHRDQLSFNYVSWKNSDIKVKYLDKGICNSRWFYWNGIHKKYKNSRIIRDRDNVIRHQRPTKRTVIGDIKSNNNYTRTVAVRSDSLMGTKRLPTYSLRIYN